MTAQEPRQQPRILNLSIAVAVIVMFGGLVGAAGALARRDFSGTGMCLLAAGIAAGMIANAVLRA